MVLSLCHSLSVHSCRPHTPVPPTLSCIRVWVQRVQWGPWPWRGREGIHCCAKPLASPPLPLHLLPLMNNGGEKYIYLLTAPAPWLRPFSLAQTAAAQGPGFWAGPTPLPASTPYLTASQCHPTHDCLRRFWSWALLSVLEMGNQAWFWKGQVGVFKGGRRRGGGAVITKFNRGGQHHGPRENCCHFIRQIQCAGLNLIDSSV